MSWTKVNTERDWNDCEVSWALAGACGLQVVGHVGGDVGGEGGDVGGCVTPYVTQEVRRCTFPRYPSSAELPASTPMSLLHPFVAVASGLSAPTAARRRAENEYGVLCLLT